VKAETEEWMRTAEGHFAPAEVLLREAHYPQCIFLCEQAIECLLKAIWTEHASEGPPPRVHDLVSLAQSLELPLTDNQTEFLRKLQEQYMPARYADVRIEYSRETAEYYCRKTEELFRWLRARLN
jgi:HEPN domain-containing protein